MNVYFDCETTITNQDWAIEKLIESINPPANYKNPEAIEKWWATQGETKKAEAIARTALDTSLARIICIGFAIDDEPTRTLVGEEAQVLNAFFEALQSERYARLVGHNILGFDIPLIYHRAVINCIVPHKAFHMGYKPWTDDAYDTAKQWAGHRDYISLDKLCRLLGIPGKGDLTGADVPNLYAAGEIDKIATYCADDVERTRAIYRRLTNQKEVAISGD